MMKRPGTGRSFVILFLILILVFIPLWGLVTKSDFGISVFVCAWLLCVSKCPILRTNYLQVNSLDS